MFNQIHSIDLKKIGIKKGIALRAKPTPTSPQRTMRPDSSSIAH
jgi:hypothetical protein